MREMKLYEGQELTSRASPSLGFCTIGFVDSIDDLTVRESRLELQWKLVRVGNGTTRHYSKKQMWGNRYSEYRAT